MEEFSLSQYVMTKEAKCIQNHQNCMACTCNNMVTAGKIVLEKKIVPLSYLWNKCFTGMAYDCEKVQKRLLQIPLAALKIDGRIYIVEKKLNGSISDYESLIRDFSSSNSSKQTDHTSREEYDNLLCHVAQSEPEKEILKHVLCSNLSKRKASRLYGISLLRKRAMKVNEASRIAKEIKERNMAPAKEQKKTILLSYGLDPANVLTIDSEFNDSDSSDDSDDEEVSFESSASENDEKENYELEAVEVNYVVVLEILKESSWNWFSFVILLEEHLKNKGYSLAVFDQVLMDFAAWKRYDKKILSSSDVCAKDFAVY
jgi:hypothetical protein